MAAHRNGMCGRASAYPVLGRSAQTRLLVRPRTVAGTATPAHPSIGCCRAAHDQGGHVLRPTVRADTKHFTLRHSPTSDLAADYHFAPSVAHLDDEVNPPPISLLSDNRSAEGPRGRYEARSREDGSVDHSLPQS